MERKFNPMAMVITSEEGPEALYEERRRGERRRKRNTSGRNLFVRRNGQQ